MQNQTIAVVALDPSWWAESGVNQPAVLIPVAFVLIVLLVFLYLKLRELPSNRRARKAPTLTPQQVEALMLGTPPRIVDLRPREIYDGPKGHIRGSMCIPLAELRGHLHEIDAKQRDAIILVDETDELSHRALPLLAGEGCTWVYVLRGGMRAWRRAKLPVYTTRTSAKA